MKKKKQASRSQSPPSYELRLFITGNRPQSMQAIQNIKQICETSLQGRYHLQVIDVYQEPQQAIEAQIVAAPTLVKMSPLPARKFVGDMSNRRRLLKGLNVDET